MLQIFSIIDDTLVMNFRKKLQHNFPKISHEARLIIHRRPLLIFFVCSPPSCLHATTAVLLLLSSNHLTLAVLYLQLKESLLKNCIHETPLALARLIWAGYLWWLVSVQWLELLYYKHSITPPAFEAKPI